jgi:uncharacterized protein (UPF0261 family)
MGGCGSLGTSEPSIAILATLDTKLEEASELERLVRERGWATRIVDVGLDSAPRPFAFAAADVVAGAAGTSVRELRAEGSRDAAMRAMGEGAARLLGAWHENGELAGAVGLGGNQGTAIAAIAVRSLPIGLPKLIVSTVASGNTRSYVGDSDVAMLFSVGDLLGGPNAVTQPVLANAAAAICGMAGAGAGAGVEAPARGVAVTAFGNTHRAAETAIARLRDAGCHVVPFHASGACGSAMERLIDEGVISAVLDLTTHELLAELYPQDFYAPVRPGRLTAAARAGIPQVVAPGGLEYFCFGAPETVPPELRERPVHAHNPFNMNVRTSAEELGRVGAEMARRLNEASGACEIFIPLRGWSEVGAPGGVLHDPAANRAFVDALQGGLRPEIRVRELDTTINDPAFAGPAADALIGLLEPDEPEPTPIATGGRETNGSSHEAR